MQDNLFDRLRFLNEHGGAQIIALCPNRCADEELWDVIDVGEQDIYGSGDDYLISRGSTPEEAINLAFLKLHGRLPEKAPND